MKAIVSLAIVAIAAISMKAFGQELSFPRLETQSESSLDSIGAQSSQPVQDDATQRPSGSHTSAPSGTNGPQPLSGGDKWRSYLTETFVNPLILTGGAFRAAVRTTDPPNGYPIEWRRGPAGFGRNFGDALAVSVSLHTAAALTAIIAREDHRYLPSRSHNPLARTFHALAFTVIDRSDSGRPMPAWSNVAGAAAGGFVGNAYLPSGFDNLTHARQRATIVWGGIAAENVVQEFAPQIPKPLRVFLALLAQ